MDFMRRAGEGMAKKPLIPFVLLIVITAASAGVLMVNPPSFDMDEGSFTPDNEFTRASAEISEAFTSTAMVMSMIDAGDGNDIFTVNAFIEILEYEKDLMTKMEYTDTAGNPGNYYSSLPAFTIANPVSRIMSPISGAILSTTVSTTDYGTMISVLSGLNDAALKALVKPFLMDPAAAGLLPLFTNDLDPTASDFPKAHGCMVTVLVMESDLDLIADGQLGFENDAMSVAKDSSQSYVKINVVGLQKMMSDIGDLAQRDIGMLVPIALVIIVILLILIYRDIRDTLIGLLGLFIAIIWTFGIASVAGVQLSTIAIAVPILIMALGIDYGLHLVFRYREERMAGHDPAAAIGKTLGSVGESLLLATVTTAIAFLSYLTSSMSALADFGVMCAIGITCAFGAMLLLVPPLQVRRDRKMEEDGGILEDERRYRKPKSEGGDVLNKISGAGGRIAAKSPWAVLGVVGLLMVGFGISATNLSYDFNMYDFIPEGTEASNTLNYMNENYTTSSSTSSVLIYLDSTDDIWELDTLTAIEGSLNNMGGANKIGGLEYFGSSPNYEVNAEYIGTALSAFNKDYGSGITITPSNVPPDPITYSDYYDLVFDADGKLLTFTTPAELIDAMTGLAVLKAATPAAILSSVLGTTDDGRAVTRIILNMENTDFDAIVMKDAINEACAPIGAAGFGYMTTGSDITLAYSLKSMNDSQMTSLFITIILVVIILTIFMWYIDRSWLLGAMATVPTLISVVMVWGMMALMDIPMNVMTLTIASLTVGMGVTYGIHVSHRYATELKKRDANGAALISTRETGKVVFATAATTVAGFGIMVFSKMIPMFQFGVITALAIGFGYLGSIFVLPSMLVIWGRYVKKREAAKIE